MRVSLGWRQACRDFDTLAPLTAPCSTPAAVKVRRARLRQLIKSDTEGRNQIRRQLQMIRVAPSLGSGVPLP